MGNAMVTGLAQVAVSVGDVERAKIFYGQQLGLPHLFDAPPGLAFFQCGETRLMLSSAEGPATASTMLYFGVADAAEAQAALELAGVAFAEPARPIATVNDREVWLAAARDGEGNVVGLISERDAG